MPVTLAQAKLNTQDDIQAGVIDEFRKSSFLLEQLTFDDVVTPGTNQSSLTYGYTRLTTQPTAAFRAINTEYTPAEVQKNRVTVDLKIFGGAFSIDRVLSDIGGLANEVNLQMTQKIKAARSLFHDTVINGDSAVDALAFDGLNKALTGTTTEFGTGSIIDLSTDANLKANGAAFLDLMDDFLSLTDTSYSEGSTVLLGNFKMINRLKSIARRLGYYKLDRDEFGRNIEKFGDLPLIDLGPKSAGNIGDPTTQVVPVLNRTVAAAAQTGLTDLYVVRLGMDGFHGISLKGQMPVRSWLPPFDLPGAVKNGEVEMVAAIALKATRAAGVFRNIKIQ